ncbi:Thioredoxin [Corchorus olitorius]|uniref:Thioredoxin n=1 Tax=Corchorus olitorius TaxID=93759 RepID=A0A1R3GWP9_9ROSI|nr:Thioredoxin [Corchorus olitorius]
MDTLLSSSSSLVVRSSLPPVRAVTSPSKLYSATFSFAPSIHVLRRNHLSLPRSLASSTVPKFSIRCGAIKEIKESEFQSTVLESNRPVLVEFVATWCGPCRLISSAMESIAQDGQEVPESRREGAITKPKLKEYVDALLDSISVA